MPASANAMARLAEAPAARRRPTRVLSSLLSLALAIAAGFVAPAPRAQTGLPLRLTDAEFRALVSDLSEPEGVFRSDNLVSNEDTFQVVVPELQRTVKAGGVYVGVGPDQNFTYIAALKPAIVFIPDIRRGNLQMHLMYKALMELSPDRSAFLSRLFSRKKPEVLAASATADQLFQAYAQSPASRAMFDESLAAILTHLRKARGFQLSEADAGGIEYILSNFYSAGPYLQYASGPVGRTRYPSFAELQTATDGTGTERAYLATEENYRIVRAMQQANLIVPAVGNFGGPRTLKAIGAWVRARGARVTTFYTSNVEQYLLQDRLWDAFAANVAAMPLDETSTLIRSCFNSCINTSSNSRVVMLLDSMQDLVLAHQSGLITSYYDVLSRKR
jgi:hypothetical protein